MPQKSENEKHSFHPILLYLLSFYAGTVIMVLEMLGFRLLAPYFGYSIYIWGSLIGIIMAALSGGYFLGGTIADRFPGRWILFFFIFLAGVYLEALTFCYKPILAMFQRFGLIGGSMGATVVTLAIPILFLSCVGPFIIKMLAGEKNVGSVAGRIYAISTIGSIAGTFLSSFILLPYLGSYRTLYFSALFTVITGGTGLILSRRKLAPAIALALIVLLMNISGPSPDKNVIFVGESPYNHVKVVRDGDWYTLKAGNYIHSIYNPHRIMIDDAWDYFCLGPLLCRNNPRVLVLGLGGGTSVRQYLHLWKDIRIDALDIDPVIVKVATDIFSIPKNSPRLNLIVDDARGYLLRNSSSYDVITIDLFRTGEFIPFYVATREFYSSCRERMSSNGLLLLAILIPGDNTIACYDGISLFGCFGNTLLDVFPSVYYIEFGSTIYYLAFNEEVAQDRLTGALNELKVNGNTPAELHSILSCSIARLREYKRDQRCASFTDDRAPIDRLTFPSVSSY